MREPVNIKTNNNGFMFHLSEAIPGVDFVDFSDVIFPSVDSEQPSVRVVELI